MPLAIVLIVLVVGSLIFHFLSPWTFTPIVENFKAGVRGTHQNDIYGAQMRIMAQLLESDEQVKAVAAYIATIDYRPGGE